MESLKSMLSVAENANWYNLKNSSEILPAIKNTWGVDCKIYKLSENQITEIEQQYPIDTNFNILSQQYQIKLSNNSIFIHEHGAWIDYGYLKFYYHGIIYYINVAPLVDLTQSIFDRMDDLSHMAKIMISLGERGRVDRTSFVALLDGDLVQT